MDTPTLHPANITGSPTTTFLGLASLFQGAGQMLATNGLPTNTVGWVVFGLSGLAGLFGILGKG
jgi:hypothetical protein